MTSYGQILETMIKNDTVGFSPAFIGTVIDNKVVEATFLYIAVVPKEDLK